MTSVENPNDDTVLEGHEERDTTNNNDDEKSWLLKQLDKPGIWFQNARRWLRKQLDKIGAWGKRKEPYAIIIAILFLAMSIGAAWLASIKLEVGETLVVIILVIPLVTYFILTERISAIKAGDLVEATFSEITNEPTWTSEVVEAIEAKAVEKLGIEELDSIRTKLQKEHTGDQRIVLSLRLGYAEENSHKRYDPYVIEKYIQLLSTFSGFEFVVILNRDNSVFGYISQKRLIRMLNQEAGRQLVRVINEGDKVKVADYSIVIRKMLKPTHTNTQALRQMVSQNLEAMVVTNADGKMKAIAEREQILTRMMIAVAEKLPKTAA